MRPRLLARVPILVALALAGSLFPSLAVGALTTSAAGANYRLIHTVGNTTTKAIVPTLVTGAINADFVSAFNSWNASLPMLSQWTLVNYSTVPMAPAFTGNFDITKYIATTTPLINGMLEFEMTYTPGMGAGDPVQIPDPMPLLIPNGTAVWSQSVLTNQKLAMSLPGNPYLDNPTNAVMPDLGPPAYPFQYANSLFYDKPSRNAEAEWSAVAYLSKLDSVTRTLTVYDGVLWGFSVHTPEPSTLGLMAVAVGLGAGVRSRRRQAALRAINEVAGKQLEV